MTVLFSRRGGRPLLVAYLVLLALSAAGCSAAKGDLSGTIAYNGKPLVVGSILLIGADAKPRTAWIEADSSYRFMDVPVGEAKLAVISPDPAKQDELRNSMSQRSVPPEPVAPDLPAVDRTKWFAIPAEYGNVDHSGLRVTINRGPNTYPIEMK